MMSVTLCGIAATMMLPATAQAQQDRVSATEKGSLVIFPKVELRWDATGQLIQDTFISLTNDNPQDVRVQLYFVNGDPELNPWAELPHGHPSDMLPYDECFHAGWNYLDNEITLTGDQPIYWSAASGMGTFQLSPFTALDPGCEGLPGRPDPEGSNDRVLRGFIYGWATNRNNEEIRWNHLKGEATIINYADKCAWEYNSYNHQVVTGAEGDQSGTPGVLNLDGSEYSPAFNKLILNFAAAGSTAFSKGTMQVVADTDITLHSVSADFRQETEGPITVKASFDVWNENEVKFSGLHRCITCWDQTLASNYGTPNHLLASNLQTNFGKARIDGLQSQLCDFDYDQGDNKPLGDDPRDIVSQEAALIGVAARYLTIDGMKAKAGGNLVGSGTQAATVQYDVIMGSEEANAPELPQTSVEVLNWLEGQTGIKTETKTNRNSRRSLR
jgi:hypothetical protein